MITWTVIYYILTPTTPVNLTLCNMQCQNDFQAYHQSGAKCLHKGSHPMDNEHEHGGSHPTDNEHEQWFTSRGQ